MINGAILYRSRFLRYKLLSATAINHWLSDSRNTTGKRTGGTFYTEATAMLRCLRLRTRSVVGFEMEGDKAHRPPRDGRVCNQKQKRYYRSDISRSGEHGKNSILIYSVYA